MKTFAIAALAALLATTVAQADGLSFIGDAEYQFEAERFETNLGLAYELNSWTFIPVLTADYTDANGLDFVGAELTVAYTILEGDSANLDAYARVETDADFEYSEAAVGVMFSF